MNPLRPLRAALATPLRVQRTRAARALVVPRRSLATATAPASASVSDKHVDVEVDEDVGEFVVFYLWDMSGIVGCKVKTRHVVSHGYWRFWCDRR